MADGKKSVRVLWREVPRALFLVWRANRAAAMAVAMVTLGGSVLPAAMATIGKRIVDSLSARDGEVTRWLLIEVVLACASLAVGALSSWLREVLRLSLSESLHRQLLDKALLLSVAQFEDANTYDAMQNARREASNRPLGLAMNVVASVRSVLTLVSLSAVIWTISPWAVLVLAGAALPAFFSETRLAGEAYRVTSWRAPEGRRLNYLEWILTRSESVKEVKLFGLGPFIVDRWSTLQRLFASQDRRLATKRLAITTGLGAVSLVAFYGCYASVAQRAQAGSLGLGDVTLALAVFRQGQSTFESLLGALANLYSDALFLSNFSEFLALPTETPLAQPTSLPGGAQRLELRGVSFRYPGRDAWALRDVSMAIEPGEKLALVGTNGAGKTTLIKLLLGLYQPTEGVITYGGVDLRQLDAEAYRQRIAAVFQDFVRYQFTVSENVELGDVAQRADGARVERALMAGGGDEVVASLPEGRASMLGGMFEKGHELSGGQWQKLAISRAFMRENADVLILDEPTAAIDAEAEVALFERFATLAAGRTALIISHRFSTVRMANRIAVLENGRLLELGSHQTLVAQAGRYAQLFALQARGYR